MGAADPGDPSPQGDPSAQWGHQERDPGLLFHTGASSFNLPPPHQAFYIAPPPVTQELCCPLPGPEVGAGEAGHPGSSRK